MSRLRLVECPSRFSCRRGWRACPGNGGKKKFQGAAGLPKMPTRRFAEWYAAEEMERGARGDEAIALIDELAKERSGYLARAGDLRIKLSIERAKSRAMLRGMQTR
jgi:hypothetical protein